MRRKDLRARILAEALTLSMAAGLCAPATAVFAAGGNEQAIIEGAVSEEVPAQTAETDVPAAASTSEDEAEDGYTYCYAALTYKEYYENEGVLAGDSVSLGTELDTHKEPDRGAFDAVSRATAVHGLHRGNFQGDVTIYDKAGQSYRMSHWVDEGKTIVLTDGTRIGFSRGVLTKADGSTAEMDKYEVTGIKYVPVAVSNADLEDFKQHYQVVENGGTLAGGLSEVKLSSYSVSADVSASTNGLKKAVKNADGTYSFQKRQAGTASGIQGQALKSITQEALDVQIQQKSSYGDLIRVDLKGDYGDIGANMQAVIWEYYGNGDTVLQRYGTKFAADNWMHKSNGVQLGLTESLRCQFPQGSDGTGRWKVTVCALGYADTTLEFQIGPEDIHISHVISAGDKEALRTVINEAKALSENAYSTKSWETMQAELKEAEDIFALAEEDSATHEEAEEAVTHLRDAVNGLEKAAYVLMNIPYDAFYKAEINNSVSVDAFSSATLNKSRTNTSAMAQGSYHVDPKGTDITGITYPVKVGEGVDLSRYKKVLSTDSVTVTVTNRGQTSSETYKGQDALFENPSYAYHELDGVPGYFKEVTVSADNTLYFGKAVGTRTVSENVKAELLTETGYGDYQMNLDGIDLSKMKVFGVVLETKEGSGYGLRHVENIWRQTQLAWCTGFTDKVHNCPTSQAHYAGMMGQNITKVIYYTDKGIIEIPLADTYVPVKFGGYTLKVSDAAASSGSTTIQVSGLKEDLVPDYSVEGLAVQVDGEKLMFKATNGEKAAKGAYTLTVKDKNGRYAPLNTTFILYTEDRPAVYDPRKRSLVTAEGSTADDLADYIKNITSIAVDGTAYAATGRGKVEIISANGALRADAEPLKDKKSCSVEVTATGYLPLGFTYPGVDTKPLQASIQAAEKLEQNTYTAASWAKLQEALQAAKKTLTGAETQEGADKAAEQLDAAMRALVKKTAAGSERPGKGTTVTYGDVRYQVTGSSTAKALQAADKTIKSAKIPAKVTIRGYSFRVTSVDNKAFSGCKRLKTVEIGSNVTAIGNDSFAKCIALQNVKGAAKVKKIGNNAFSGCKGLKKLDIKSASLTKIGASAFKGCTSLVSFTAKSTRLSSIGKNAFSGDKKLAAVSLKTSRLKKANVGKNAFKKIKNTCMFRVPAKKVSAYKSIFRAKGAGKKIKVKKL